MSNLNDELEKKINEMKHGNDSESINEALNPEPATKSDLDEFNTFNSNNVNLEELRKHANIPENETDPFIDVDALRESQIQNQPQEPTETVNENTEPAVETAEDRASKFAENNPLINIDTEEAKRREAIKKEKEENDPSNSLFKATNELQKDSDERAKRLAKLQEKHIEEEEAKIEAEKIKRSGVISTDDVDAIINELEDNATKTEYDIEDEEDLSQLLQKLEENKTYATVEDSKLVTGPANFDIEENNEYVNNIEEILKSNNINIVKKKNSRDAILKRFTQTGTQVTVPLPNSGIFIKMCGAGTDEIIAMQNMNSDDQRRAELNKLNYIVEHMTDSTVGKMKLSELIETVSFYDKDTLYYALYAATFPKTSEFSRICPRCGNEYYMTVRTQDLLTNPDEFDKDIDNIKDNVTTLSILLESSKLGHVYKKIHSSGMIIYIKHPSIRSYLDTLQHIDERTKRLYPRLIDLAYSITKILIHGTNNDFVEITNPNEIISYIAKIKDTEAKYEIYDMVQEITPAALPVYGLKSCTCPHCGVETDDTVYTMEDMLFTQAHQIEEMTAMRWAAKDQKRKKDQKRLKNNR